MRTVASEAPDQKKRFATLRARAALAGIALNQIDSDDGNPLFIATRWALTRQLATLDEVAIWLQQVTGVAG